MAEGVFSISADIVPVIDERQLETQAQAIVNQFNKLLAKEVKPVQLVANTKGLEQAQSFTSRIISQLNIMDKDAGGFNRTLSTTANIFDLATKNAVGLVQRGIRPILDGMQQIAPIATRAFSTIASLGGTAFNIARAGALQFTNAINLTSTNILGYAGNIRKAIQENTRFKDGLDFIKRSGDALKTLPQTFANVQAQVIAGVSPLQRAADAGSGMARSLTPFLVVGVAVAREVSQISASIRSLVVDAGSLAKQFVVLPERVQAAFDSFGKDGPAAKKAVDELKTAIPGLSKELDQLVIESRGKGLVQLQTGMKDLRDQFVEAELHGSGLVGVIKRLFTATDFSQAKAQLQEINRTLLDLGADKGEVPFFKRFAISATDAFSTVEELIRKIQPQLASITGQVGAIASSAGSQGLASVKASGIIAPPGPRTVAQTLPIVTPATVAGTAATGAAAGQAILSGLKSVSPDFLFFFKTAFAGPAVESTLFTAGAEAGKDFKDGVKSQTKDIANFLVPAGSGKAKFDAVAAEASKSFQGGLESRLAGSSGKNTLLDAIGLNTANVDAAGEQAVSKVGGIFKKIAARFKDETGSISLGGGGGGGGLFSRLLGGGEAEQGAEKAAGGLSKLKGVFSELTGSAGVFGEALGPLAGAAGLGGLGIAALNAAAHMETLKTALAGIFGAEAKEGFKQIQAFAAITPFTTETATDAVIKLGSAFKGLSIPGGLAITKQIAGAAAAIGASDDAINRVTLAFTQIQAAGKLTADNVRQITEALPNVSQVGIVDALAKTMGVTRDQAKSLYQQGLVPADKGLQAIIQSFHDVPGAATALAKQSQTFTGLVSTAKDTVTQLLAAIGQPLLAAAKPALKFLIANFQFFNTVVSDLGILIKGFPESFENLLTRFSPLKTAINAVGDAIQFVIDKIKEFAGWVDKVPLLGPALKAIEGAFKGAGDAGGSAGKAINDGLQLALDSLDPVKRGLASVILATDPKDIIKNFQQLQDSQEAAHNALVSSNIDILKKVLATKSAFDAQKAAAKSLTDAQTRLTDAVKAHDKEVSDKTISLEKELTAARNTTAEANDKVAESQTKLNELLKGASQEDLEKSDLSLASAKLRLRQIIEDEKKAQDELNATQQTSVNITGLTVDQIKSRLSVARAALAAQKELASQKPVKTVEQASIDKDTAAITKREAELAVVDALKTQNDLKAKGSELDPEIIAARKEVAAAQKNVTEDIAKEQEIQTQLNILHAPDLAFEKEKKGLQADITAAKVAQADADFQAKLSVAEAKNDQAEVLRLLGQQINQQPELKRLLTESNIPLENAKSLSEQLGGEFVSNKTKVIDVRTETDKLNEALQKSIDLGKAFGFDTRALELQQEIIRVGQQLGGPEKGRNTLIDKKFLGVVNEFLAQSGAQKGLNQLLDAISKKNFGEDFEKNPKFKEFQQRITDVSILAATRVLAIGDSDQGHINDAVKQALLTIPGIGPLKFAQGGILDKATNLIAGEAGREAVLPLTRPMRMADIIGHPQVLPPVLAALDKISLPQIRNEPINDLSGVRMVRSTPQIPTHHEQAKRDAALAKAIVSEMKAAGVTGQTTVNNTFVEPDANDPLAKVQVNQIAREVKRQIEKLL